MPGPNATVQHINTARPSMLRGLIPKKEEKNLEVELEKLEKRLCNLERKNSESESRIIIPDWATVIEITGKIR